MSLVRRALSLYKNKNYSEALNVYIELSKTVGEKFFFVNAEKCIHNLIKINSCNLFSYKKNTLKGLYDYFLVEQNNKHLDKVIYIAELIKRMIKNSSDKESLEIFSKLQTAPGYRLTILKKIPPKQPRIGSFICGRICYVLQDSFPYSSGGYATRGHGVAIGLKNSGFDVICMTRPGFPTDVRPELSEVKINKIDIIDGINYKRTFGADRSNNKLLAKYVEDTADILEKEFSLLTPEVVIAASNHTNAMPALIAARRLGIPFIYEVRGFWEITQMSRDLGFVDTPAFWMHKILETEICNKSECVFTLTSSMREELIRRGVESEKIQILPNSCDINYFTPSNKDKKLLQKFNIPASAVVIGYIGTFVDYEGLEDLVAACAILKDRGHKFRLLLVGSENVYGKKNGKITAKINEIAKLNGFSDWLIMPGRLPHEEVYDYYTLIDVVPIPRKPWPVCEMVSPMKPLEALAMEKAVVVSNVRALTDIIMHNKTGLCFEKNDITSLANELESLINDKNKREQLGKSGREWIIQERTWELIGIKARQQILNLRSNRLHDSQEKYNSENITISLPECNDNEDITFKIIDMVSKITKFEKIIKRGNVISFEKSIFKNFHHYIALFFKKNKENNELLLSRGISEQGLNKNFSKENYLNGLKYTQRDDVVILPTDSRYKLSGSYDNNGFVPESMRFALGMQSFFPAPYKAPRRIVKEPVIYAGEPNHEFGHFILESCARLWYAKYNPDIPVCWTMPFENPDISFEILNILGIKNKFLFINEPTLFRRVFFPYPGVSIGNYFLKEHANFLSTFSGKIIKGKKVFLSRSQLGKNNGKTQDETLLDEIFNSHGFLIFHPEKFSLAEQLKEISSSQVVVGIEGSALHLPVFLSNNCKNRFVAIARHRLGGGVFQHIKEVKKLDYSTINIFKDKKSRYTFDAQIEIDFDLLNQLLFETSGFMQTTKFFEQHVVSRTAKITNYEYLFSNSKLYLNSFEKNEIEYFINKNISSNYFDELINRKTKVIM